MKAGWPAVCPVCDQPIEVGDDIVTVQRVNAPGTVHDTPACVRASEKIADLRDELQAVEVRLRTVQGAIGQLRATAVGLVAALDGATNY